MNKKELEKKAASKAVAVAAAAGIITSSVFSSPVDLLQDDDAALMPNAPVVEYVNAGAGPDDDDDASASGEEDEGKRSVRERVRCRILRLPQSVRAVVGVPLWGVGWVITNLLSLLWSAVLSPAFAAILKWAVAAALILSAVLLTLKTVFPDIPLKKLLSKRNLLTVFIGMGVLGAADTLLRYFAPDHDLVALAVRLAGSLGIMTAAVIPTVISENRHRRDAEAEAAEGETEEVWDYRREILELADSVK